MAARPNGDKDAAGLITLGRVVKPHGVRGELRVQWYADSPRLFGDLEHVFLSTGRRPKKHKVLGLRAHHGAVLLTLAGVVDRDQADALRGCEVMVDRAQLEPLDEDEVYLKDLIGLQVRASDGSFSGTFENFIETKGQEVWVLKGPGGVEVLFPAVDEFIDEIDLDRGVIEISPPPGLVDLYLSNKK